MGKVHYNGLHWCSPLNSDMVNNTPRYQTPMTQYTSPNDGGIHQFSAAFIVASGEISYTFMDQVAHQNVTLNPHVNNWNATCYDINSGLSSYTNKTHEIVLRLYWQGNSPTSNNDYLGSDPGATLGQGFYSQIVKPAVQTYGIRNFQVLNELNLEYERSFKTRSQLAGDMFNIAWWIKHLAQQDGIGSVYLGFPGPGGASGDPASTDWNNYWATYGPTITRSTDQGSAYNWLAVHSYDSSDQSGNALGTRMKNQYDSLTSKFPTYAQRYTEYGIPLSLFTPGYTTGGEDVRYWNRASAYKTALTNFKTYVDGKTGPDVWSVFAFVAYASDFSDYNLVQSDNSYDIGPAQTVADAFQPS